MSDFFTFGAILDTAPGKQTILACKDISRKSISMWKQHEDDFGRIIFRIKHKTDKLDVLVYTSLDQKDVELKVIVLYTQWQIDNTPLSLE